MSIFNSQSPLNPRNSDLWVLVHMQDCKRWSTHETAKQYYWEVYTCIVEWEEAEMVFSNRRKIIDTL